MTYELNHSGVSMYTNKELEDLIIQIAASNRLTPAQLKDIFWTVLDTIEHELPIAVD